MKTRFWMYSTGAVAALLLSTAARAAELGLEIGSNLNQSAISARMDHTVRLLARNFARLAGKERDRLRRAHRWPEGVPLTLPTTLYLSRNGSRLGKSDLLVSDGGGSITLSFDSSGSRAFPVAYQQLLQDTFTEAQSTINAVFGNAAFNSTIHVRNYDADIGDRDAVAGGYYVPDNGFGEQEIRIPVYSNSEAAAVNFVHCLLLAYMGPNGYGFDAFREGIVRAAALRIVRTAGAMPASLDPQLIDSVLEATYDVGTFYDWYNQRGLGGAKFIAPNLRTVELPAGGSLGGAYLLRYQMAGTAWQKVLVEYPAFAAAMNAQLYAQPSLASDVPALIIKAQQVIDSLAGSSGAMIEGRSFADWFQRQFILHTQDTLGQKLICHPIPLPPVAGSSDFGVFDVPVTWFETTTGGNEILLSGTSYPIFWSDTYDRIFPSSQEDRMDIAGAYGSVTPNIPKFFGSEPYRSVIDIPVQDKLARVVLPVGSIATGDQTVPRDFYGTYLGPETGTLRVRLTYGVTVVDNIPITHGAFGALIGTSAYLASNRCRIEVIRTVSSVETVLVDRFVNKGPGALGVDLRFALGDASQSFGAGIPKGLSTLGISVDPYSSSLADSLGISETQVLVARWNGSRARYDIAPDTGMFQQGMGYFVRLPSLQAVTLEGKSSPNTSIAVALRPGWNLICNPTGVPLETSSVRVIHAADSPSLWSEAVGTLIGTTFFSFTPGPNDQATGAPETGTFTAATQFAGGQAYFVRVLVAEGVTLLFTPGAGTSAPSSARASTNSNSTIPRFLMKVKVEQLGSTSEVFLGKSPTATAGFDPAEDSGLPPSSFGLQGMVESGRLYTDIRRSGRWETYTVRFDGLRLGTSFVLSTEAVLGSLRGYDFRFGTSGAWHRARGPIQIRFFGRNSSVTVQIRVGQ